MTNFRVPLSDEELLATTSGDNYSVQTEVDADDVEDRIEDFRSALSSDGAACHVCFIDHFDSFFALPRHWNKIDWSVRIAVWKLLIEKCLKQHFRSLRSYLDSVVSNGQHENDQTRLEHLNALQMLVYILCRMAERFENEALRSGNTEPTAGPPGKVMGQQMISRKKTFKKDQQPVEWGNFDWELEKSQFLRFMKNLLDMPLHSSDQRGALKQLWSPPFPDENFSNLIVNCCCKMLEDSQVSKAAGRELLQEIFDVIAILVRDYGRAVALSTRLMNSLAQFEHLGCNTGGTSVVAEKVAEIINHDQSDGLASLIPELMRELGNVDSEALSREGCAKAYATFLTTLATNAAQHMASYISSVALLLETESSTMRSNMLSVYVEIVLKLYGGEERNEMEKKQRDALLAKVKEHLMDVNAHVRSKSVQLWSKLCEKDSIPLSMLREGLVDEITGRLQDKSSIVRKNCIKFLTAFLQANPYKDKLSTTDLQKQLDDANAKLEEIKARNPELAPVRRAEMFWREIEIPINDALSAAIDKYLNPKMENQENLENPENEMDFQEQEEEEQEELLESVRSLGERSINLVRELSNQPEIDNIEGWKDIIYQLMTENKAEKAAEYFIKFWKTRQTDVDDGIDDNMLREHLDVALDGFCKFMKELYLFKKVEELAQQEMEGDAEVVNDEHEYSDELARARRNRLYLMETLDFANQLQQVLPQVAKLFQSQQTTDILEAASFVTTCAQFKVPGSDTAVRKLCNLIWRKDPEVRECVVKSFRRLYLTVERGQQLQTARNLMSICANADHSELASLEQLVSEMMSQNMLSSEVLNALWSYFSQTQKDSTPAQSHCALRIISMAAKNEKSVISSNLELLSERGLSEPAANDFYFAADVCGAMEKLGQKVDLKQTETIKKEPFRLNEDYHIFTKIVQLLLNGLDRFEDLGWTPFMESGINVIFFIAEHPDKIAHKLIKDAAAKTAAVFKEQKDNDDFVSLRDKYLVRVLALIGHVALRILLHIDVAYCGELKRRSHILELEQSPRRKNKKRKSMRKSMNASLIDAGEEEMGLAGATAEDIEQEMATKMCEDEVMNEEQGLLAVSAPLVTFVLGQYRKYSPQVQVAAATALAKLMLISVKFCEQHLQQFFTLLQKSPIATVRASLVIAAGDLFFRFPNAVEPYGRHLYDRLNDPEPSVRQNCLLVLTHIILNDMMKVKGQVALIAQCTLDTRQEMAGLAKRFFTELAQKGNAVYNQMPDIISRLSDPGNRVEAPDFQQIMKFLLGFMKERHCESLVEKLCQRFQITGQDDDALIQWRYLSYCLSQLSYNEKSFSKLKDNLHCFADKLGDNEVFQNFVTALASCRKAAKTPESKLSVDETEEEMTRLHTTGFEDAEAAERAKSVLRKKVLERRSSRGRNSSNSRGRTPRSTRKKRVVVEPESDTEDTEGDMTEMQM